MTKTQRGSDNTSSSKTRVIASVNSELVIHITFGGLDLCQFVDSATPEPSAAAICGIRIPWKSLLTHLMPAEMTYQKTARKTMLIAVWVSLLLFTLFTAGWPNDVEEEAEENIAIDSGYHFVISDFVDRVILIQASIKSDGNQTQPLLQAGLTSQLSDRGKDYKYCEKSLLFQGDAVSARTSSFWYRARRHMHWLFSGFRCTERCLPRSLSQETGSVSSRIALPRLPRKEEGPLRRVAQIWGRVDQLATLLLRFLGIKKIFRERLFSCIADYRRVA